MVSLVAIRTPAGLDLPPGYTAVALRESGDAFAHACRIAPEAGAGTLVWVRRFDVAEFAVVLEPDEPLTIARKAFFMGMVALADSVAAHAPPERPLMIRWPDGLIYDGGLCGGGRLGVPRRAAADARPDWLVFGAIVRVAFAPSEDPGSKPDAVALSEEGFDGIGPSLLIESFARFFMREADHWQNAGFDDIGKRYLQRLEKVRAADRLSLAENGDLLTRPAISEETRRDDLLAGLRRCAWLDRKRGAPR